MIGTYALVTALDATSDVETALRQFEAARLPVGHRIIERARHLGAYLQARKATDEERAHSARYSIPEAAKSLGVDPANVRGWVEKFSNADDGGVLPSGEGALKAELRRLRKENARLLMEREILKKAAAFFAREQP